jgi:hypothetical protein
LPSGAPMRPRKETFTTQKRARARRGAYFGWTKRKKGGSAILAQWRERKPTARRRLPGF